MDAKAKLKEYYLYVPFILSAVFSNKKFSSCSTNVRSEGVAPRNCKNILIYKKKLEIYIFYDRSIYTNLQNMNLSEHCLRKSASNYGSTNFQMYHDPFITILLSI